MRKYNTTIPTVKVDCTVITREEIELIINTYNQIND